LPNAILQALQSLSIQTLCGTRQQGAQYPCHMVERACRRLDRLLMRPGGQQKDRHQKPRDAAHCDLEHAIDR
jgi:hypothetical protein